MNNNIEALPHLLRGSTRIVSEAEFLEKLKEGRPLRIKLGVDPTAPDLHLGHTVVLSKLRAFQKYGHTIVFIIGDFTAAIGDPSGRDTTRPPLSEEAINANIKTYQDQVFKILNPDLTEVRCNGEWLYDLFDRSHPTFLPKTLLRSHTVQQLMERDDFAQRRASGQPITLLELMYPLFQGYDSVAVQADVELGGNDQIFNLLMGRQMQKDAGQKPQVVMTMPLLEGLDGVRKMSKSYGNHVGLNDPPNEMFGKLMSIPDALTLKYAELLTDDDLSALQAMHPMQAKKQVARNITAQYWGPAAAIEALNHFERVFSRKETPDECPEFVLPQEHMKVPDILVAAGLAPSKKEARRLLEQGGVQCGAHKISVDAELDVDKPVILKVGKRRFIKLIPFSTK